MAHNIDMTNGRANVAFLGSRKDVWHRLGFEMKPGMTIEDWAKAAGLDWQAIMVPSVADLSGPDFDHLDITKRSPAVPNWNHMVRSDTGGQLGHVSDIYKPVQPAAVLAWFDQYISVDPRFKLDVAGSLKGGKVIWATAVFADDMTVAGDKHVARLLMSTTFDASSATINQGSMTRTVCENTLLASYADKSSVVKTKHISNFDAERVGRELAQIAQGFGKYKAMGDAMGQMHMAKDEVSRFFKACLDIPFDAKSEDVSKRKLNQFEDLNQAYAKTAQETEAGTRWAALNAVTRHVDHARSTHGGASAEEGRFMSSQFGSGAAMKAKAVEYLTSDDEFKALLAKPFQPSGRDDLKSLLARPFTPSRMN